MPDECATLSQYGVAILTKANVDNRVVVETVAIAAAAARRHHQLT